MNLKSWTCSVYNKKKCIYIITCVYHMFVSINVEKVSVAINQLYD